MVDEGAAKITSPFQVEDEVFTAEEHRALQSAKIVVPSEQFPTVLDALEHARAPEERRDGEGLRLDRGGEQHLHQARRAQHLTRR